MKKKIHFLPFNLFWLIHNFLSCYLLLPYVSFTEGQSVAIGLIVYLLEVKHATDLDYLEYKMKLQQNDPEVK